MRAQSPPNDAAGDALPVPRQIPFDFPDDLDPQWHSGNPEFAAMINGASLTMPYLEPFLIRTVRAVMQVMDNPQIDAYGRAFNTQEQFHYRVHRRFNDLLKKKGYPVLATIENQMIASYARLSTRSLRKRMAYTAGFETMTMGLTRWLVGNRVRLFAGADTRVVSFVLWHMVEETEHKCIAHDIYQAAFGGSFTGYLARMVGVFHGALHMLWYSKKGYRAILQQDGRWTNLKSRLRLLQTLLDFALHVGPYILRGALPGHNPRNEKNLQWVTDWINGYESTAPAEVPLVDTSDPVIPVPFNQTNAKRERMS